MKSQLHKHKTLISINKKKHVNYRQIINSVLLYKFLNNFVLKALRKENVSVINKKQKIEQSPAKKIKL